LVCAENGDRRHFDLKTRWARRLPFPERRSIDFENRDQSNRRAGMAHEEFMSQEEVDALLKGVTGETDTFVEQTSSSVARPYNLSAQERIVRGRMAGLEIINDRCAAEFFTLYAAPQRSPWVRLRFKSTANLRETFPFRPT
jgi:hypothetical protein